VRARRRQVAGAGDPAGSGGPGSAARAGSNNNMKDRARPYAKLLRPSAGGLLRRERLFAALDAARAGTAAWIAAPGGAGKTSLVSSWIDARRLPCLWVSLDAGDADPAAYFFYFATAARAALGTVDLPPFGAAHRAEPGLFGRRFFERLFAAAEPPLVVVLDGYHVLPPDAPVHAATDALLASAPPGALVVVASREPPPPRLARWSAAAGLAAIGFPALRLTRAETAALAAARGFGANGRLDALHEASRGWAAGVVLLARGLEQGLALPRPGDSPPAPVFDYFAAEVFGEAPPDLRAFLLRTAFLPRLTAGAAEAAAGDAGAGARLEALHRAQLFVERREDGEAVYAYHPLFREFLQSRAAAELDPPALAALRSLSARLAAEDGDAEAAGRLLAANADWGGLVALVRREGPGLAAHDRHGPLHTLVELAPAALREVDPWLLFWHAWCRMSRGEDGWRSPLERAHARFAEAGDAEGAFTACAWLLRTSVIPADAARWIGIAERLAAEHPAFPAPATEARVLWQFHQVRQFPPHHPLVARWAERAVMLVRALDDAASRMRMAAFALSVHFAHGEVRRMGVLVAETHALAGRADAPASDRLALGVFRGYYHLQVGDLAAASAALAAVERLAAGTGLAKHLAAAWHFGARLALCAGELDRARDYHERLEGLGDPLPPYPFHIATHAVYLALAERDLDRALATARAVLAGGGSFPVFRPLWRANLAQVLLERGDAKGADAELGAALEDARGLGLAATECCVLLLRAAAEFALGESEAAHASLADALGRARAAGCVPQLPFLLPATLARLCARALERGIEREFVTDLVARWRLAPPSPDEERWPWRIRVRALGAFDLAIEGDALNGAAKTQRKPVELLKCVIAFGGRDVAAAAVMQALWPEAEGDAAKRSFDVTLHRLRRLLGRDDAVLLEAGKLALNPGVVWVDAAAFERLAARAEEALRGGVRPPGLPVAELIDRALRLYRGPLLLSDDESWTQAARERLRNRHLALVERAGDFLERTERTEAALACYQRAVDLDPPAERIYQRIMRILYARGRRAEALEVYRRCREMLAATLGALPSSETEALHREVRHG